MENLNPYSSPTAPVKSAEFQPGHIGSVFGNAWRMYIANFWIILGVSLFIWLPVSMLVSYVDYNYFYTAEKFAASFRFTLFMENFIGVIGAAAVIWIGMKWQAGEKFSLGQALVAGARAWPKIWVARFVTGLATLAGFILFVIPGIYIAIRLSLAEQIAVAENVSGSTAMRRSYEITKGHFWFMFSLIVLGTIISIAPIVVMSIPVIFYPELDNWLVTGVTEFFVSFWMVYGMLCLYCAYHELAESAVENGMDEAQPKT